MLTSVQKRRMFGATRRRGFQSVNKSFGKKPNPAIEKVYLDLGGDPGKRTNRCVLVKCFYHDDTKASMGLYTNNNTFYCFTCAKSGNSYQLIIDKLGLTYGQAVEYCEEKGLYE